MVSNLALLLLSNGAASIAVKGLKKNIKKREWADFLKISLMPGGKFQWHNGSKPHTPPTT